VFVVTTDGIILADPLNTDFAVWLKERLNARFGVPVRYVMYSHYHWDHASGGAVFADTARFVGHANMASSLEMPPASTTLSQVVGQYEPVAALDKNGNEVVEASEAPADLQRFPGSNQSQFEGFDANKDGVLNGAEIMRGPVSFVRPPDITYGDEMQVSLGGKRVTLTWAGKMNHSKDSSIIAFPDDSLLFIVDYVSFKRLPNREMDYELGMFEEWMAAIGERRR
jgi:glyoxylase-like metal-dependent hydrolase (beta-lactamase superfamily II)